MSRGAVLVADDQVVLKPAAEGVLATAPANLEGRIEARGIGILAVDWRPAWICLVIDIDRAPEGRLPAPLDYDVAGQSFPCIAGKGVPGLPAAAMAILSGGLEIHS